MAPTFYSTGCDSLGYVAAQEREACWMVWVSSSVNQSWLKKNLSWSCRANQQRFSVSVYTQWLCQWALSVSQYSYILACFVSPDTWSIYVLFKINLFNTFLMIFYICLLIVIFDCKSEQHPLNHLLGKTFISSSKYHISTTF